MSFWKKVSAPLMIVGLLSPVMVNCGTLGQLAGGASQIAGGAMAAADCPALRNGDVGSLAVEGGADVQTKVRGFIGAVYEYDQTAASVEADLIASCRELGAAMNMSDADLQAEADSGEGAKAVCNAVSAKIKATIAAKGEFELRITPPKPPVCEMPFDAMQECLAECGAAIDPGNLTASCEGGSIRGDCTGDCKGTCIVEGSAECGGTCDGTCQGKCDGEDVSGTCEGKCEGSCSGTCSMEASGKCEGTCEGACTATMEAPTCTGTVKPPSVSVDCQANCAAQASAKLKCHPPSIGVELVGEGDASADLKGLVTGLETAYPKIISIQQGVAARLKTQGQVLVEQGKALPSAVTQAGAQAQGCLVAAGQMAFDASASVSVSVEASANVSGSIGN